MYTLVFDTETTGLVDFKSTPAHPNQPNLVQLGAILFDGPDRIVCELGCIVRPLCWKIPPFVAEIHGITTEIASKDGLDAADVCKTFARMAALADSYVCHNIKFDMTVMETLALRTANPAPFKRDALQYCTMAVTTPLCKLPGKFGGANYKWPKLQEAHKHFFGEEFEDAHSALSDVRATARIFWHLVAGNHIKLLAA